MAESKPQAATAPSSPPDTEKMVDQALAQAKTSIDQIQEAAASAGGAPLPIPELGASGGAGAGGGQVSDIELLSDVDLQVSIELGRTQMLVEDVLKLNEGSVVELDKLAGDPVDVFVNHRLVARGEVLVVNDNFCIRISEIVANLEEQAEQAVQDQDTHGG